jgi:hypothetical protein
MLLEMIEFPRVVADRPKGSHRKFCERRSAQGRHRAKTRIPSS